MSTHVGGSTPEQPEKKIMDEDDYDWNDPPKAKHIVMGPNSLRCLNCGREQELVMPCSISVLQGAGAGFTKDHYDCEPSAAGKARFEYTNPWEWHRSWDTGISSLVIYSVMEDALMPKTYGKEFFPHDPADFGRCHRLLKVGDQYRERLHEVSDKYPQWEGFVDAWDELTALWEEESPSGKCPKLFERLQGLVKEYREREKIRTGAVECPECDHCHDEDEREGVPEGEGITGCMYCSCGHASECPCAGCA